MGSYKACILVVHWKHVQEEQRKSEECLQSNTSITSRLLGLRMTYLTRYSPPAPQYSTQTQLGLKLHRVKEEGYTYLPIRSAESTLLVIEIMGITNTFPNHPDWQGNHSWWLQWLIRTQRQDWVRGSASNFVWLDTWFPKKKRKVERRLRERVQNLWKV